MEDGELVASFKPGEAKYVVALAFEALEDAMQTQERVTAALCGWTDDGERYDRVETLLMAEGQLGRRELFDGQVVLISVVTTATSIAEIERLRRAWATQQMQKSAPALANMKLSDAWTPGAEQRDYFEKWANQAIELDPAGVEQGRRQLTSKVRAGFNQFARDHGRPDLQLTGSAGGRALSALIQGRFTGRVETRRGKSNNTYYHGLQRKHGARSTWFPGTPA